MFNGMMDPEMLRLAQKQMSRMSPAEFAKIQQQMMSNPELMKMATESMKNMRPEDLKRAAEQLNQTHPEDMADVGQKLANASPEEIAAMRARVDAQMTYEYSAADMLKKKGNELHSQGRFGDAMEKYMLAKKNLNGVLSSKGRALSLACSLNLMSCYLKTKQYDECIKEGSEVLEHDAKNVKALYRRGQAYKEVGRLSDAVCDLSKAHEVTPDDETITNVLRDAEERLDKEGGHHEPGKLVIEEITEEVGTLSSREHKNSSSEYSVTQPQEGTTSSKSKSNTSGGGLTTSSDCLQGLKDDPGSIRSFQNFISGADPETLAALSGGRPGEISPDMFKTASNMISKMSPEELQRMLQMASSFQGGNQSGVGGSSEPNLSTLKPGSVPSNVTPDMLKTASDMMSKMSAEELQKMFQMASSVKNTDGASVPTTLDSGAQSSDLGSRISESRESISGNNVVGETSSQNIFSNSESGSPPNLTTSAADIQQLRNQMNDPAMKQMFASMMKNMNPEMMANMSEQFGFKLSQEEAAKVQQAMSSLSSDDLDKMMRWADKLQRGVEGAKRARNWLLGRPGMILAIVMLILAVILHCLGYIGS